MSSPRVDRLEHTATQQAVEREPPALALFQTQPILSATRCTTSSSVVVGFAVDTRFSTAYEHFTFCVCRRSIRAQPPRSIEYMIQSEQRALVSVLYLRKLALEPQGSQVQCRLAKHNSYLGGQMSSVELTASHRPRTMSCTRSPPMIGCPPKVWGVLRWPAMIPLSSLRQVVKPGDTSVRGTAPSDESSTKAYVQ